ncbi:MAG: O-antigen ligase family protein [Planctomycetota bacterium]|jgi:hypothetical protein
MIRGTFVAIFFLVGTKLALSGIAFACSFYIWNDIFRPLDFARRWVDFPAVHYCTLLLALSLVIHKWHRRWNVVATMLCILIAWMCISTALAQYQSVAQETLEKALKYLIPLVVISISLTKRRDQLLFVYTLAISVGLWSAQAGLYCFLTGQPEIRMNIPTGQMTDRNDFMGGTIAALPLIAFAAFHYSWRYQRAVRLFAKAMVFFSVVAIFYSLSRGAIVGITVLLLYYIIATGRFGRRLLIGAAVLAVGFLLMPSATMERLATVELSGSVQKEGSAASRLQLAKIGVAVTLDHPITGIGPDNFPHIAMNYGHWKGLEPHVIWLKASAEYGIPMLILFILIIFFVLRALSREAKAARLDGDTDTEALATALACSLVGFLAAGTFRNQFLSEFFWATMAVVGAFVAHRQHERRTAGELVTPEEKPADTADEPAPARS